MNNTIEIRLESVAGDELVTNPTDISIVFNESEMIHLYDLEKIESDGIDESDARFIEFSEVIKQNIKNTGDFDADVYKLFLAVYKHYFEKYHKKYNVEYIVVIE